MVLQLPSPPHMLVDRDYAGGYGTASSTPRSDYGHGKFSMPYVSLMYSAALLEKAGHDVVYIDGQAERLSRATLLDRAKAAHPSAIVTVVNLPSFAGDVALLDEIRHVTSSSIVAVGAAVTHNPSALFQRSGVDVAILGEPEPRIPLVIQAAVEGGDFERIPGLMVRTGEGVRETPPSQERSQFDKFPWPAHHLMPMKRYLDPHFGGRRPFFPIWGSRGCPMPCAFYCPYPWSYGREILTRPPEDVVAEMEHVVREYGTKRFLFRDQIFTFDQARAETLCDRLLERRLKVRWLCETRVDMVNERLLRKMKRAGCERIHYGLESGDEDLFKKLGKPGVDLSRAKETLKLTRTVGITAHAHLLLGLPGENWTTIENTLKTIKEVGLTSVYYNIITPYPGTPLHRLAMSKGWIEESDLSKYTSYLPVMRNESMSAEDLERAKAYLMRNHWETFWKDAVHLFRRRLFIGWVKAKLDL